VIEKGSGAFNHGHTYVGHATACAAGLAVQQVFEEDGLIPRVAVMGDRLADALAARFDSHPHVGDVRGRGLFRGVELVADRASKEPFPVSHRLAARLKARAMDNGLICYPMAGTADGAAGDHVLLAPPFVITDAQIEELVDKLARSIDEVIAQTDRH
jgi:adenosylmethionine-8-amino-7-oxononanoate aminotransferase